MPRTAVLGLLDQQRLALSGPKTAQSPRNAGDFSAPGHHTRTHLPASTELNTDRTRRNMALPRFGLVILLLAACVRPQDFDSKSLPRPFLTGGLPPGSPDLIENSYFVSLRPDHSLADHWRVLGVNLSAQAIVFDYFELVNGYFIEVNGRDKTYIPGKGLNDPGGQIHRTECVDKHGH